MSRQKKGYAVVAKGGHIDIETIRAKKRDVDMTIYEEETGAKVRKVIVTLAPEKRK